MQPNSRCCALVEAATSDRLVLRSVLRSSRRNVVRVLEDHPKSNGSRSMASASSPWNTEPGTLLEIDCDVQGTGQNGMSMSIPTCSVVTPSA